MAKLVSAQQIAIYKAVVIQLRSDLGRNVILHIPGPKSRCYNCLFDVINKRSTGIYSPQVPLPAGKVYKEFKGGICPVCKGTGQVTTEIQKTVLCLIRSLKVTNKRYLVQGIEAENDYRLKTDIAFMQDFLNARIVVIDGIPAEVKTIVKSGLKNLIQIIIYLKRSEFNGGSNKANQDVSRF